MPTLVYKKHSISEFLYTGGSRVFNVNFSLGVLTPSHIQVYVQGEVDGLGDQLYRAFTYDTSTGAVTVTGTIANNAHVVIQRTVPKDTLYLSFQSGADVTRKNIDTIYKISVMAVHEILDGRWDISEDWQELNDAFLALKDDMLAIQANIEAMYAQIITIYEDLDSTDQIVFVSRAAAAAANVGAGTKVITVLHPPMPSAYTRPHLYGEHPDCTAIVTNGGTRFWAPAQFDNLLAWGGDPGDDTGNVNFAAGNASLLFSGCLYIPSAKWSLNGAWRGRDWKDNPNEFQNIHIYGDGPHASDITQLDPTVATILVKHRNQVYDSTLDPNDYKRAKMKPIIHDLSIKSNVGAAVGTGGCGIRLHECKDGLVHNVLIDGPDIYIDCQRAAQITFLGITGQVNLRQDRVPAVGVPGDPDYSPAILPNPVVEFLRLDHNPDIAAISGWQSVILENGNDFEPGKSFGNRLVGCEFQGGPGCDAMFGVYACDGLEISACHLNGWRVIFDLNVDGTGGRTTFREISMNNTYFDCDGPGRWFMTAGPWPTPAEAVKGKEDVTITGVTIGTNVTIRGRGGNNLPTGLIKIVAPNAGDLDNLETMSNIKFIGTRFKAMQGVGIQIRAHSSYVAVMKDKFKKWTISGCETLDGQFGQGTDEDDLPEKPFIILSGSGHSIQGNTFAGWRDKITRHFIFAEGGTNGAVISGNLFDMGTTKIVRRFSGSTNVRVFGNTNLADTADGDMFVDDAALGKLNLPDRAALVLWTQGNGLAEPDYIGKHIPRDGALIEMDNLVFMRVTGETVIPDLPDYVPYGDVYPDHFAENTSPGVTNMRDAIANAYMYTPNVKFRYSKYLCSGNTVTLTSDFTMTGEGWISGYGGGVTSGSIIVEDRVTSGSVFKVQGATSSFADRVRSSVKDIGFTSAGAKGLTNLTGITVNLFSLKNTFMNVFDNCLFDALNVTEVIGGDATGSQNGVFIYKSQFTNIGDAKAGFAGITGRYTYGRAVNMLNLADSAIEGSFLELCGKTAITLGGNCRSLNNFNDLSWRGYDIYSYRAQVIGGTCKWHKTNGIYIQIDARDFIIDDIPIVGNNYGSATGVTENFAIRFTTNNTGWRISNIFASDTLQVNHPDKTQLQNFVHLGSIGNSGQITNVTVGDVPTNGVNIYDPSGVIASGKVDIDNIRYVGTIGAIYNTDRAVTRIDASTNSAISVKATEEAIISGSVQAIGATTLFSASRNSIGPFVIADQMPTVIIDKTGAGNTGAVSMEGFSYLADFTHAGTAAQTNVVAPVASKIAGRLELTYGNGSTTSFFYSSDIQFDGTTLVATDAVVTASNIGEVFLGVVGGNLVVSCTAGSAVTGKMLVKFRGTWMQAA